MAAVFTMPGFGLFGKTPLNVLPLIAGVYLAAKVAGKSFREYILIALFGTALGPLVTMLILETGLPPAAALPAALACGFAAGFIMP